MDQDETQYEPLIIAPIESKDYSKRTINDHLKLKLRKKQTYRISFTEMEKRLKGNGNKNIRMRDLLAKAEIISKEINRKIDRLAKRNKKALILWFCENWDLIALNSKSKKSGSETSTAEPDFFDEYFDLTEIFEGDEENLYLL